MAVERTTIRVARKQHPCNDPWCQNIIQPGELYAEHVTSPHHYLMQNTRWTRHRECGASYRSRVSRTLEEAKETASA